MLTLKGAALDPYLEDLARLRLTVFREYPYLYDGDPVYERKYLAAYTNTNGGILVVVLDAGRVIGASTGLPLVSETSSIQAPFLANGVDPAAVFYFGESVLLPEYRGFGLGVRFFEEREAHARSLGAAITAFCAVERPAAHPRRPKDYIPLDQFWQNRGYEKHPELHTTFSWKDLDEDIESPKPMTFWLKRWV